MLTLALMKCVYLLLLGFLVSPVFAQTDKEIAALAVHLPKADENLELPNASVVTYNLELLVDGVSVTNRVARWIRKESDKKWKNIRGQMISKLHFTETGSAGIKESELEDRVELKVTVHIMVGFKELKFEYSYDIKDPEFEGGAFNNVALDTDSILERVEILSIDTSALAWYELDPAQNDLRVIQFFVQNKKGEHVRSGTIRPTKDKDGKVVIPPHEFILIGDAKEYTIKIVSITAKGRTTSYLSGRKISKLFPNDKLALTDSDLAEKKENQKD